MAFRRVVEFTKAELANRILDAVMIIIIKKLVEHMLKMDVVYRFLVKGAKIWSKTIVYTLLAVASIMLKRRFELLKYFDVSIILAIDELISVVVDAKPFAVALSGNEIEVFNLDKNTNVEVWINGSKITFTTTPKTDAKGYAKITLTTPMPEGINKILVHTGYLAWFGEVVV